MKDLVEQFYAATDEEERVVGWSSDKGDIKAKGPFYELNDELVLTFEGEQEQAQFLVEVIRHWHDKRKLFCHDTTWKWEKDEEGESQRVKLPEDDWTFSYKTPSTCGGCVRGQKLLSKIFGGSERNFNALPCVTYEGERVYWFRFDLLKLFAEQGGDAVAQRTKAEKEEAAREKAEAERKARMLKRMRNGKELKKRTNSAEISVEAKRWVLDLMEEKSPSVFVHTPDIVVCKTARSKWGGSGGIGYFDQVRAYYHGQTKMREWQWRDQYSASKDRHDLRVSDIGEIDVQIEGGEAKVKVELINNGYYNRSETFTFEHKEEVLSAPTLSAEEEKVFSPKVDAEIERIMGRLRELWEHKPTMSADYGGGSGVVVHMPMSTPSYVNWNCSKCSGAITQLPFQPDESRVNTLVCIDCFKAQKEQSSGNTGGQTERTMFEGNWTCSGCGAAITKLPFEPRSSEGLKCIDCFKVSKN